MRDWNSINQGINRWMGGPSIVNSPPLVTDFKQRKLKYNCYNDIELGNIRYKETNNFRNPIKKLLLYPTNSMYIEDEKRQIILKPTWNQELDDSLRYRMEFQNEADSFLRRFDYPYSSFCESLKRKQDGCVL
jgi:hypothetical protein